MLIQIIVAVVLAAGFFSFGILFARRNTQKIEAAMVEVNKAYAAVETKVKELEAKIK